LRAQIKKGKGLRPGPHGKDGKDGNGGQDGKDDGIFIGIIHSGSDSEPEAEVDDLQAYFRLNRMRNDKPRLDARFHDDLVSRIYRCTILWMVAVHFLGSYG
jgi:hypothetical protein